MSALIRALAESPQPILQTLAEQMLDALDADSAGISLLKSAEEEQRFYWPAIAGMWKPFIGGGTPRDFGPCGDVLDRDCPLLFRGVERRYPYYEPVRPRVEECLLVPFYLEGKAVGTLWIVAHDKRRQFDAEDLRLMQSLAQFASAAYNTASLIEDLKRNSEDLENSQAELRKRIANLQTTTEALKSANVDLKHFAYAVSHDLRQPLRAITSYCELLLRRSRLVLGEEAAAWGDFITSGCRRMEALLRDLLSFAEAASIDRDTAELVDSDAAFEIAVQNLRVAIQETQATITRDRLPVIRGHKAHIIQLMQNLIGNSIKYRSDQPSRIHATAEPAADGWHFIITDNGVGIEPQYHQRVFEPFERLHGFEIPGTGLGLAICRRIVERCGGKIWVESQPGKGASFHFTLHGEDCVT